MSGASFRASNTQQGLTENMQILTGQKGDRLDKALTLREAAALGMVNLRRNGSGQIVPELPPDKPTDPEWSGVQQPVAPTGVTADGAFHTITLTWDTPAYKGHSYAEVLRAEVDNPSSAIAIGTTLANVYSDAVGKGFSAFYWVRFINKNGLTGPLHSTAGLRAATSPDVDEIIASATNFAIYNPAKPNEKEIVFGVTDDGKVAIREAVIKAATIQIIHSEKITADYVKAGVSISSPLINGGQIDMGNAFMAGGAAGFGKGGPYGGWGWGWHTIIYADGSLYTNRLYAEGGYVRNMTIGNCTIGNCTIDQDCIVKGTVYANKIVGDVCKVSSTLQNNSEIYIEPFTRARKLVVIPCGCKLEAPWTGSSFTTRAIVELYVNGRYVSRSTSYELTASSNKMAFIDFSGYGFEASIEPNQPTTVKFVARLDSDYSSQGVLTVQSPLIAMAFIQ